VRRAVRVRRRPAAAAPGGRRRGDRLPALRNVENSTWRVVHTIA